VTIDLKTQIERYTAAVLEVQNRISVDEAREAATKVVEPTGRPTSRQHRTMRPLIVAAAAAVIILALVGGVAWLGRQRPAEPATPTTTIAPTTTTTSAPDPEPPPTSIPMPPPESLTRSQMEHQVEFLDAFQEFGFLKGGGCRGQSSSGPVECEVEIISQLLGGPVTGTWDVAGIDDDMTWGSLYGQVVRENAEAGLASLYIWALETHRPQTEALCRIGFTGDAVDLAWSPGYVVNSRCGSHLAGLLTEFAPSDRGPQPDPEAGMWTQVEAAAEGGEPNPWVMFDIAPTPIGLIATGLDGLWISQDGANWQRHARDAVDFEGDGGFSKIAVSSLGIVVGDPDGSGLWYSADGQEWVAIGRLQMLMTVSGRPLAATDDRFVVISAAGRLFSSADGRDWIASGGVPERSFVFVEATPQGFFAAKTSPVAVWHSPDGVDWSELSVPFHGLVGVAGNAARTAVISADGEVWTTTDLVEWTQVGAVQGFCARVAASETSFLIVETHEARGGERAGVTAWYLKEDLSFLRAQASEPISGSPSFLCTNAIVPFEQGFLGVTDNQGGASSGDLIWAHER
jgi:hypothetical protein